MHAPTFFKSLYRHAHHMCNVYLVGNAYFQKQQQKNTATKEHFFVSGTEDERT